MITALIVLLIANLAVNLYANRKAGNLTSSEKEIVQVCLKNSYDALIEYNRDFDAEQVVSCLQAMDKIKEKIK